MANADYVSLCRSEEGIFTPCTKRVNETRISQVKFSAKLEAMEEDLR